MLPLVVGGGHVAVEDIAVQLPPIFGLLPDDDVLAVIHVTAVGSLLDIAPVTCPPIVGSV